MSISYTVKNQGGGSAGASKLRLVYSTNTTISTTDPTISDRDVASLGAGAQVSGSYTWTIPSTVTAASYYIGAIADVNAAVAESNENNQTAYDATATVVSSKPDLIVQSVTPSKTTVAPYESFTVTVKVKNQGTARVSALFYVDIYKDRANAPSVGLFGDAYGYVTSLSAGSSTTLTISGVDLKYSTEGTKKLWVLADSGAAIAESDEGNNYAPSSGLEIKVVKKPDLVVQSVTASPMSPQVGESVAVTVVVKNNGLVGTTASFRLNLYADRATPPDVASVADFVLDIPLWLDPGQSAQTILHVSYATAGTKKLWVLADGANAIDESDEGNNAGPPGGLVLTVSS
jgi:subtilase family serine protease